jgi:hypothetical protein
VGVPTQGANRGRVGTHSVKDMQGRESWFNGLSGIAFREKVEGATGRHRLSRTLMNEPINSGTSSGDGEAPRWPTRRRKDGVCVVVLEQLKSVANDEGR